MKGDTYRHMVDILCVNWVGTALCTIAILVGVFEWKSVLCDECSVWFLCPCILRVFIMSRP